MHTPDTKLTGAKGWAGSTAVSKARAVLPAGTVSFATQTELPLAEAFDEYHQGCASVTRLLFCRGAGGRTTMGDGVGMGRD